MKYSKSALGLLTAQYRSVLRKCMLINLGLFALGAVATATTANAEDNKYNMSDGANVILTENENINNSIDTEASGRTAAILAAGNTSIDTGAYTLKIDANGSSGRNYIFNTTTNNTDFSFSGNLIGQAKGTGSAEARGLRQNAQSSVLYNGSVKVGTETENANSIGIDIWNGSTATFNGELTDISTKITGNGFYSYALQNHSSEGSKVYLNAAQTNLNSEGGKYAEAMAIHQGSVYVNGNANISAANGFSGTRAINVESDAGNPYDSYVSLSGDSINVTATSDIKDTIGLFSSGTPSTIDVTAKNLNITSSSTSTADKSAAQGLVSQYGANINIAEGSNTTIDVKAATNAYGIYSANAWNYPGHFTSHGNLTVNAEGTDAAYGAFVYKDSSFTADQISATATSDTQAMGAAIISSTDVKIGSADKNSALTARSDAGGYGIGLYLDADSSAALAGNMVIDGSTIGIDNSGTLTSNANLTVKNGEYGSVNNEGTINFTAGAESVTDIAGGIDGENGVINMTGAGIVNIANALANQTVNVNAGELHLSNVTNTENSAIAVADGATFNSIDNVINDYTSSVTLADGSNFKADFNANASDTFTAAADATLNLEGINILEGFDVGTTKEYVVAAGANIASNSKAYTGGYKYTAAGSSDNSGKVSITNAGSSLINDAVEDTESGVKTNINYNMADDEAYFSASGDDAKIQNSNFVIEGNDNVLSAVSGATGMEIENSDVTIKNLTFENFDTDYALKNNAGSTLRIVDSHFDGSNAVAINNAGTLYSDPTIYEAQVINSGTATFENDSFQNIAGTALTNNGGEVTLRATTQDVEFTNNGIDVEQNAGTLNLYAEGDNQIVFNNQITGTGTNEINLTGGTSVFNANVSGNDINIKNDSTLKLGDNASIDGLALANDANGGTIDMRNKRIDTLGSVDLNSNLSVLLDANLNTHEADSVSGAITDTAGTNSMIVNAVELLALSGNSTETVNLATASNASKVSVSDSAKQTLNAYYQDVDYNNTTGVLTLSNKQQYANADLVGAWGTGNYIKAYDSTNAPETSVGANLTILDDQVFTNEQNIAQNASDIADETTRATTAEAGLGAAINAETARAQGVEGQLSQAITNETTRAQGVEGQLSQAITNETARAQGVEGQLSQAITDEAARAQANEAALDSKIETETARATTAEAGLGAAINAETARAQGVEGQLSQAITNETTRAQGVEGQLSQAITNETARAQGVEGQLSQAITDVRTSMSDNVNILNDLISDETTRATTAEADLGNAINDETARAQGVEGQLSEAITNEQTRAEANEAALKTMIETETDRAATAEAGLGDAINAETVRAQAAEDVLQSEIDDTNAVIGNVKDLTSAYGNFTNGKAEEKPGTVENALHGLDETLGQIHGLSDKLGDAGQYGNLAVGTTVEQHLTAINAAIGNRNGGYSNSMEVNYSADALNNQDSVVTSVSQIASNIGTAKDLGASYNGVSANNTVNQNIANLNSTIGDVSSLSSTRYASGATNLTDAVRSVDAGLNSLDHDVRSLRHHFEGGMASAAALSALVPNARASGNTQLSLGTGAYKGHGAAALGGFHWINDNWLLNAGVAFDNSEATYRVGVTYSW